VKFLSKLENNENLIRGNLYNEYPGFITLHKKPFIGYIDDAISHSDIDHIISCAAPAHELYNLKEECSFYPAAMTQPLNATVDRLTIYTKTNLNALSPWKTIRNVDPAPYGDKIHDKIRNTISELTKQPIENMEPTYCGMYPVGAEFQEHWDALAYDDPTLSLALIAPGGQRLQTVILYCNDNFEGGETYFRNLDITVKPKKGRVLLFHNVTHTPMQPEPKSLHCGKPVTKGTKYTCVFTHRLGGFDYDLYKKILHMSYDDKQKLYDKCAKRNQVLTFI